MRTLGEVIRDMKVFKAVSEQTGAPIDPHALKSFISDLEENVRVASQPEGIGD